jgi:surfactin synthase thioesterase subunit
MALVVNDRVKETSTTTGTGTFTLAGAVLGFETFSTAIGNTNTTYYSIVNENGEFEVGLGTVGAGTLARTTILSSSNSDAAVNFSAGTKDVFCTLPASKAVILDSSGNIVANNGSNLTNLNADNLASGTVPDARFPATLPAANGSALTNLDADNLASGTLPDARFPATLPAVSGANLTSLNASNLASGTVPIARIDLNLLTTSTADADGDFFAVVDSVGAEKKLTKANINISGFNNDSGFIDGSSLNASNLDSGTVPDARFPATLPAANGSALTALNASNVASGTLASDRLPTVPTTKGGTGLTTIGTANQVLAVNSGGTALEYQTPTTGDITGVTAGSGLTGGGSSGDVTLNVGAGALIDVTADAIDVDLSELTTSTSDADGDFFVVVDSVSAQKKLTKANINISGFNNDSGFIDGTSLNASNLDSGTVPDARFPATLPAVSGANLTSLNASNLASGTVPDARFPATLPAISGANLTNLDASDLASGTVPIARIDLNLLTTSTADGDGDFFVVVDSVGAEKKLTKGNINISGFNNNSGFTTNTGTVTSVSGGNGLTGTVTTSGSLAVGAGTGIDVAADAISVDVSDFMTNGVNNRVLTATGADAMNAEANMTFDGSTLAVTGAITATGDVTAFFTSDKNLKQNIVNIDNSLDKVSKLNGVYYNWTKEALEKNKHLVDEKEVGVIAQDVEAVLPELVATREDGSKAVRYERLCAVLIESVKELKKEIEELKKGA